MKPVDINNRWLNQLENSSLSDMVWEGIGGPVEDRVNIISQILLQITWEE